MCILCLDEYMCIYPYLRKSPQKSKYHVVGVCLLPNGDDLSNAERVIIELGDKDGCHCLVQGGAVHVDGGSHRQHETSNALVHPVVFLHTLKCHRQRG